MLILTRVPLGEQQPTPIFLPGESHGQRRLAGYSPWDRKEFGTTEWPTLSLYNGASQVALVVKNPPANAGDVRDSGSIPGLGRFHCRRKWQPTPVFLPGESHGQRSLAGYSLWVCKESDTTEQLSTAHYLLVYFKQYIPLYGFFCPILGITC